MPEFDLFRGSDQNDSKPQSNVDGIDLRPRKWVVVHNEVVLARLDWTIQMNRIFSALVSQLAIDDEKFQLQRIRVKDLEELSEVSSNSMHEKLADATQRLVREPIEFRTTDHQYEGRPIFSICRYVPHAGYIEALFNDYARKYLLQIRDCFTKYQLKTVMRLSTSYAVRFYQIAKMIQRSEGPRTRVINIDEFRKLFMLTDKYQRHADLRKRVIKPSVEEVNKRTDAKIKVGEVRKNDSRYSAVTGLKWTVWPSNDPEPALPKQQKKPDLSGSPDAFQNWFNGLDEERQVELWKKAQDLVADEGHTPRDIGFSGYVEMKLREITKDMR